MAKEVKRKQVAEKGVAFLPRGEHHRNTERPRYYQLYQSIRPKLQEECGIQNVMQIPKIEKIVLMSCQGKSLQNSRILDLAIDDLERISGQKPIVLRAKKSVAAFKLREGVKMAAMVTLRGDRMYEFYDKMINLVLPRVRDFRGLPLKSFDGNGNYSFGFRDQLVFPEIDFDRTQETRGLGVTIVTTTRRDDWARQLLRLMEFPFVKK